MVAPPFPAQPDVSLLIPARRSGHSLETAVREAHAFFARRFPGPDAFEIVLVPNPAAGDAEDRTVELANGLAASLPGVRSVVHAGEPGKGAALRTGFGASRGRRILFTDADLPYDLEFFDRAIALLDRGCDFVTGNRRLGTSAFDVPVSLLPIAYGRHRLGLGFNRVVRRLLPIETSDTQAGIKAMSRAFATEAFGRQTCPGFFFDLELFLCARRLGFAQAELPVTLYLNTEKSTVRVLRESFLAAYWLLRIARQNRAGHYGRRPAHPRVLPRYRGVKPGLRLFLAARWWLTPYRRMAARLPAQGPILDLGCGHGLLALAAALDSPKRDVLALDHDLERLALARRAAADLGNLRFEKASLLDEERPEWLERRRFQGIAMIDVMHYFPPETQERLAREAFARLEEGGTLIVREVDPDGGLVARWNRLYEQIATRSGFTQADAGHHFRSVSGWREMLARAGFDVRSERCSSALFADVLYVCRRPEARP